ncbi:metallophosphoesterase [Streptococcus pluranimalium]|uniref:metallophosphoesterase n=1 Tax=Streptococcus pluranimalium TaxID=82348 RepID=UPI0039FBC726
MAEQTLIVLSDSHGDRAVVEDIKAHYEGNVDAIFHNGDSELPSTDPIWQGIHVVKGNCDYDDGYQQDNVVNLAGLTIAQTHGHCYHINFMWRYLVSFAKEAEAAICLYGHLHRAAAWQEEGVVFINPGSVLEPRGEVTKKLYAKVVVTDYSITVDFLDLNHQIFPDLSQEFTR